MDLLAENWEHVRTGLWYLTQPTWEAAGAYAGYLAWMYVLTLVLPGQMAQGQPLDRLNGKRRWYKLNGLLVFLVTVGAFVWASATKTIDGSWIYREVGPLAAVVNLFSIVLSVYLYLVGRGTEGPSEGFLNDFVFGVQLNPEVFGMDLKMFSLKPAMTGWILINLSVAHEQWVTTGGLSLPMWLYQAFTFWYSFDYYYMERSMLSTWDIIAEHFGLMLVWGDYFWISFSFAVQPFFLLKADADATMSFGWLAMTLAMFMEGYFVFRTGNLQKDSFKTTGKVFGQKAETIGGRLLVSGLWGVVRKPNYTGDLMLALSYSMPTAGICPLVTWLYPTYLFLLLLWRANRDNARCAAKYGKLWDAYVRKVPYTMVPGVY